MTVVVARTSSGIALAQLHCTVALVLLRVLVLVLILSSTGTSPNSRVSAEMKILKIVKSADSLIPLLPVVVFQFQARTSSTS